jgi:hypothetical protein
MPPLGVGVLECWSIAFFVFSTTPLLHHSILEGFHRIIWFISNMGSNIEITTNPTIRPMTRIITGSSIEVNAMMWDSTSLS